MEITESASKLVGNAKWRRRTKIVKVKDFPEGVRSMTCQCKVWGTKVIKTEKIIVEKACEYFNV